MTALLKVIRRRIDRYCLIRGGLNKDGCKVVMTGVPAFRLVVDFDKPGSPLPTGAKRCDYFLFAEDKRNGCRWVMVLELKRGQLRTGTSAAENLVPPGEAFRFWPIAASGPVPKYERQRLRNSANMIVLHGKKEPVRLMSCGARLVTALD